jgi:hypothetical protein
MAKQERQMRVKVFRNLHFTDRVMWSVQYYNTASKTWLLMMHTPNVMLRNAEFKVSEAGRQRVVRTKRKVVHAFVVGDLVVDPYWFATWQELETKGVPVTYNPYKYSQFVVAPSYRRGSVGVHALDELESADMVWMTNTGKLYAGVPQRIDREWNLPLAG